MSRTNRGFTLLELLVVIAIIGFLAATLTIAAAGLKTRSKIEKTSALIRRLDSGCEAYFTKFQDYPAQYKKLTAAQVKAGVKWAAIKSDNHLYNFLGRPLSVTEGFTSTGSMQRDLPPFVEMTASEVKGPDTGPYSVECLDAWDLPICYELPGYTHGIGFPDRTAKFDLTSGGPNKIRDSLPGGGGDKLNPIDDVTNWTYDRK